MNYLANSCLHWQWMQTTKMAHIIKKQMGMEEHLPKPIWKAKPSSTSVVMAFYIEKDQLYLEKDASCVSLGASFLQMRDGMWFPRNEAPNNAVL